jgi:NADPH:quinone reductase-like Zn-dependent oxidoreductase
MQAAAIDRFGDIETIRLQTLPVPDIGPDEVLIRVEAAGVGVWDAFEREGGFAQMFGTEPKFPYVLGSDGAGTIAAVGEQIERFKEGDRVYALALVNAKGGFYAEYVALKADNVWPVPKELPIEQAGAMASDALTALQGLDDMLGLKQGESLMIFGASGGIGHLAVQLAKRMGARVLAIASGDDGVGFVRRLGADSVLDGHKGNVVAAALEFAPHGIDIALLTAGGEVADQTLAAVRDGGRVAHPNGVMPSPKARPELRLQTYDVMPNARLFKKLNQLIESGPFEVHVARVFSLEQAAEAHRALDQHYLGKLALRTS